MKSFRNFVTEHFPNAIPDLTNRIFRHQLLQMADQEAFNLDHLMIDLQFENHRNRYAEATLELGICIVEGFFEALGEKSPERRLDATRHAHQK